MKKICIFGGGGHAKVIVDIITLLGTYEIAGIVDPSPKSKLFLNKYKYIAIEDAVKLDCGIIGIGDNLIRKKVSQEIHSLNSSFTFETLIHPQSIISKFSNIGEGTVIMAGAIVNIDSDIGNHVVINTGSVIEHECKIKDFSFVAPNSCLGGGVAVGEMSLIGLGATVKPLIKIGSNSIVGLGATVLFDVKDSVIVAGNPAQEIKKRNLGDKFL